MKIGIDTFRGEVPRLGAWRLTKGYAQKAVNARLLSGSLDAWQDKKRDALLNKVTPTLTSPEYPDHG